MEDPFQQTAVVLALAAVAGFVGTRLRQPLIVAFLAVGVLLGPSALDIVSDAEPIELLAEIGIAVLLFLVGLKLDLHLVRTTGPVALATGLGQVAFTSLIGFGIALALGMSVTTAVYVAVALTFSSTIIIVKLLSDKRELEDLHGRIAIGFLIVQDVVVVVVMIVLTAIGQDGGGDVATDAALVVAKGAAFIAGVVVMMLWVLPRLLHRAAASSELLLVFAVAWAVVVAAVGDSLGFSKEIGAFLAGFALASTPFREAIGSRLTPLRDFLLLFFFIELGALMDLGEVGDQVVPALVLSLFVLVGNPLIVLVIMGTMRYPSRVGFLAGLTVAQISEFSLILVALGLELGHIGDETLGLVTLVGLVTIGISTYMILYSHELYDRVSPLLGVFERSRVRAPTPAPADDVDVVVYGHGRFGTALVEHLVATGRQVLLVDWNPRVVDDRPGVTVAYGDAEDAEFPGTLPLARAGWVVSTIPRVDTNRQLVAALRHWGYEGALALTAHTDGDAAALADLDPTVVLQPFRDAAADSARAISVVVTGPDEEPATER